MYISAEEYTFLKRSGGSGALREPVHEGCQPVSGPSNQAQGGLCCHLIT